MGFEVQVYTREKWQKKRDEAKVPKGAAKVSMGDALDKFHKAAAKGFDQGEAEAKNLEKAIADYKKQIDKKYADFVKKVVGQIEFNLDQYTTYCKQRQTARDNFNNAYKVIRGLWPSLKTTYAKWKEAGSQGSFKDKDIKNLADCFLKAGAAAKGLAIEDDSFKERAASFEGTGRAVDGADTLSDNLVTVIDKLLEKYGTL
jgi:hypothetical protein